MSFIRSTEGDLVRELWPYNIGIPINDHDDIDSLPSWRIMPAQFDDICQWAVLEPGIGRRGGVQRSILAYQSILTGETDISPQQQVTFRIQGFVEAVNLATLGNWNGKEHDAPKAMQTLVLSGCGFEDAFRPQVEALDALRQFILLDLRSPLADASAQKMEGHIKLTRQVFDRTYDGYDNVSVLRAGDDPRGRVAKLGGKWTVGHRVNTGFQREDGRIVRATHHVIRKGDFVDVAVFVDVTTRRTGKTPGRASGRCKGSRSFAAAAGQCEPPTHTASGFEFEPDGFEMESEVSMTV
ncbi:hypothetical protein A0H81_07236 [Grifola frondosa]|uniref:Uncharacterized protein n=1 Tax=Grifola frondosa TaxID=5627 RepID=A0A1C7MAH4_GRIFR|nr:hypothetical protein A0H81_07236 [Grifola frondosa]